MKPQSRLPRAIARAAMGALVCVVAASASAHTPYLVPNTFAPRPGGVVTLDASFAETFFVPEAAFDNSRFSVTGPEGYDAAPDTLHVLKTRTVVEHALPKAKGTYRFSTGPRLGATFRTWEMDGKRESSRDPEAKIPEGAKLIDDFQSLTLAETYVSIDAPDRAALQPRGKGLELVPLTHPNDLYAGERFEFVVQYDGQPLADHAVEISEAVWAADRTPARHALKTDAQGHAVLAPLAPGAWLVLVRHRTAAPEGSQTSQISNSTTLTFRVLAQ